MRKEYINRFTKIYKEIPENKQKKAAELIELLADNYIQAEECKQHIAEEGCVCDMPQGKYSITRVNPWSTAYDAKIKTIQSLIDKLDKMLPDTKAENLAKAGEGLAKMVAGGKPLELR